MEGKERKKKPGPCQLCRPIYKLQLLWSIQAFTQTSPPGALTWVSCSIRFRLCDRKTNVSTFFGNREFLVLPTIKPALENMRCEGVDEAVMQSKHG